MAKMNDWMAGTSIVFKHSEL